MAEAGRPSEFTQEKADNICERLSCGESLRSICLDDDMPAQSTVFRWIASNEIFRKQYALSREAQADTIFDEILDIADDGSNDWMEKRDADGAVMGWRENGEAIQRSRLRVDARKWMAGKLRPKVYGDKTILSGDEDNPVVTKDVTATEAARRIAFMLTKGAKSNG